MMRAAAGVAGASVLFAVWVGPWPERSAMSFSAHMTVHMAVVALAAPLLAWGLAGGAIDPVRRAPGLFGPVFASMFELLVIWSWHTPLLHQAARSHGPVYALEQGTFLCAGLVLWLSAFGGDAAARRWRAAAGVGALLFTSSHMTLLGALFALAPRALYRHHAAGRDAAAALADQHAGGVIMLGVGGTVYLAGGLALLAWILRFRDSPISRSITQSRTQ